MERVDAVSDAVASLHLNKLFCSELPYPTRYRTLCYRTRMIGEEEAHVERHSSEWLSTLPDHFIHDKCPFLRMDYVPVKNKAY